MSKKAVIIGDGIAAWCLMFELCQTQDLEVIQIAEDQFFSPCSLNTTSINCLRGTQKGVSKLGDLMYESFQEFIQFYEGHRPDGISFGKEIQFWKGESSFNKRYPDYQRIELNEKYSFVKGLDYYYESDAYFINPVKLKNWFYSHCDGVVKINGVVTGIGENSLRIHGEENELNFDYLFMCTNAKSHSLIRGHNEEIDYYLSHSKPVAGSFLTLQLDKALPFQSDVNFAIEKYHFIYRKNDQIINIGSTTDNKTQFEINNRRSLKKIYHTITEHLDLTIPSLDQFRPVVGVRLKGYKRMPVWREFSKNKFLVTGLYKNAFTFAFQASKDVVSCISDKA